ncbi:MAG TPA: cache domain-containing protein, partial [Stellaceae bacterium]|nr:cache domain-containing protein [Stellaceae bacterium]
MAFTRLSEPFVESETPPKRPHLIIHRLTMLCLGVALATLIVGAMALYQTREDAWRQAEQQSTNLALALERDITRNLQIFDLSIQSAASAYNLPGVQAISPALRHAALFDGSANAEFLGAIVIFDRNGDEVADSMSPEGHKINIADRDYFRVHLGVDDVGLFVSRPFRSRVRGGDPSIGFSRRMTGPDGQFEGVVFGALRLAYFQHLFSRFNLGPNSTVTLLGDEGHIIARFPYQADDIDRDVSRTPHFYHYATGPSGQFLGDAALDGVRRLFTFRRIGNLPLILSVNLSVDDIYADWWRQALIIGAVMTVLAGATLLLCFLLRHELSRRVAVEAVLTENAEKLVRIAATDGLTQLATRRVFDDRLAREWKRAMRSE